MRMVVNIQMRGKPSTLVFAYQPGVAPYGDKPMWVQIFLLEKPMWCGSKYSCLLHKATFRLIVTYFFLYINALMKMLLMVMLAVMRILKIENDILRLNIVEYCWQAD